MLSLSAVRQIDIILGTSLPETEKEQLLFRNLKNLLFHCASVLTLLALVSVICVIPVYLFVKIRPDQQVDLHSVYFYLSMIVGSAILLIYNRKSSDYSYWSKLLHTIILDNYNIAKYLFKVEKKRFGKGTHIHTEEFVIVTGLARAGTTALMNLIFDPVNFHSISYSNMPFIMAPGLWKKVYDPDVKKTKERAHGDGVMFGVNSIEAFEEYFFKVFLNDSYVEEASIGVHQIDEDLYRSYMLFQDFFRKPRLNSRYLAKNNNYILRHHTLRSFNRNYKILLIFRDPEAQAISLLRQHNNFTRQQSEDPFIQEYMGWLGHYEFGNDHKVFNIGQDGPENMYEGTSVNYWLINWINYYQYVLLLPEDDNLHLIDYTDLLESPVRLKTKLCDLLEVAENIKPVENFEGKSGQQNELSIDQLLLWKANLVYGELLRRKMKLDDKSCID